MVGIIEPVGTLKGSPINPLNIKINSTNGKISAVQDNHHGRIHSLFLFFFKKKMGKN